MNASSSLTLEGLVMSCSSVHLTNRQPLVADVVVQKALSGDVQYSISTLRIPFQEAGMKNSGSFTEVAGQARDVVIELVPILPNPSAPRPVLSRVSTALTEQYEHFSITSCAMRSPALTLKSVAA